MDDGCVSTDQADLEQARADYAVCLRTLKKATVAAYRFVQDEDLSSGQVARAIGVAPATYRRLISDGDVVGWKPPSQRLCDVVDRFVAERFTVNFELGVRRRELEQARKTLNAAELAYQAVSDKRDLREARSDAHGAPLIAYLRALTTALAATSPWLPFTDMATGFQGRKVTVSTDPPESAGSAEVYDDSSPTLRGDVAWQQAVATVPVVVVLADAGFGKTWQLRRHARSIGEDGLVALERGDDPLRVTIPLFVHAAELARRWRTSANPTDAVLAAAAAEIRAIGRASTTSERELLRDRIDGNGPAVVLIDAYDEIFEDTDRSAFRQAVQWLHIQAGPRLQVVLSARRAGYDDPFDHRNDAPAPRYMMLGLLEESQVRQLWSSWFEVRGRSVPRARLEPAITPVSPLRRFVQVPLIAAFCAWVAETEVVAPTRAGLYRQVVDRFIAQAWKVDASYPATGVQRQDGARRAAHLASLGSLAWAMATGVGWRDAVQVEVCDAVLAREGPQPFPGRSYAWAPIREIGILVQPGTSSSQPLGDGPVTWVHRSVHEYLAATRLIGMTIEDVAAIKQRCWFHPAWANVLDFAIGLEADGGEPADTAVVTEIVHEAAVSDGDGLGWFASVLAAASGGLPPDQASREDVIDRIWRLWSGGLMTSVHLARVLALVPEADEQRIVNTLLDSLAGTGARQEVWDSIAWCGPVGRGTLAELVRESPDGAGTTRALHNVDPPRALAALSERIRRDLPLHSADNSVLKEVGTADVELLRQRYLDDTTSAQRAESYASTRSAAARAVFTSPGLLKSDDARVRAVAAHGLGIWYRNDIDREGFDSLLDLAVDDPDPQLRLQVRSILQTIAMSVPWVEELIGGAFAALYADRSQPDIQDLETLAENLMTNGPAFSKALTMILVEPRLLTGPVVPAIQHVTARALIGELDVIATRDILTIGGPLIIGLAADRIRRDDIHAAAAAQIAVGLCFAAKDDAEVYSAVVEAAGKHSHLLLEAALRVHSGRAEARLAILLDAMVRLERRNPQAIRVWTAAVRALLLELDYDARHQFQARCIEATNHVIGMQ